ncbi:MAG: hypothetical protein AAF561_06165 [Planctomycetota bacterium]
MHATRNRRSAISAAAAATLAAILPTHAAIDVGAGVGSEYLVSTTGATALGAFTSASGNRGPYLLGQSSLTVGDTVYTLPSGAVAQAIGSTFANSPTSFEPGPNADRYVYSYHSTGSVNGIRDLAIRNGLLGGDAPTVNASQSLFVQGQQVDTYPSTLTNGYGNFFDGTAQNAPVPGIAGAFYDANTTAKPIPQISYSDVRFEQAFSLGGTAAIGNRPTADGYGKGQDPAAARSYFNAGSPNFQRLADVGGLQGGVASDTTLLRNDAVAVVPFTISANPGTGLDSISEDDARFLQVVGRLQNGANFNSATRDIGSGTRNQGTNNLGIDPSWGAGERDRVSTGTYQVTDVDGNLVNVTPGDEAKPGVDFTDGIGSENPNEARPSVFARFSDKDSGGGAQRPTILSQRMALGILSVGDVGSRGRSTSTTDPLRVLAIDFEGTDNADGVDAGAVQPTANDVASGRYQLWSAAQAVTVRGSLATGADSNGALTGGVLDNAAGTIYNDVDDDGSGTGVVRKFLDNITGDASLTNFGGGSTTVADALTPLDALIAAGFIPQPLMEVSKEFDGDVQQDTPRSAAAETVFNGAPGDQLRASLNWVRAGDQNGNIEGQTYDLFDVDNNSSPRSPVANVSIGFTARTFLAGDMNGDGVRDLEDTEAFATALADTADYLAANPAITVGSAGVSEDNSSGGDLDIAGLSNSELGLVALTDMNGDGNVEVVGTPGLAGGTDTVAAISRDDVRFFLYGASVDTSAFATTQEKRELGVRLGQLKKNEAIARFNAQLDLLATNGDISQSEADANKFDPLDVNHDDVSDLDDARIVDRNVGLDYTSLDDVISSPDDLVAAELTDDNVITFVSVDGVASDFETIYEGLVAENKAVRADFDLNGTVDLADFGRLRAGFGGSSVGVGYGSGDADYDGDTDLADFGTLRANFNTTVGSSPIAFDVSDNLDFELLVNWNTGEVTLVGSGDIAGIQVLSGDDDLVEGQVDLLGLTELIDSASNIAGGLTSGAIALDGTYGLGEIVSRFGGKDLDVRLLGAGGTLYAPAITLIPEPTLGLAGFAAGSLLLRRRRNA